MKILVIGANGRAGKLIVEEAVERNLDVTAVTRTANQSKALKSMQKDLFDLTKDELKEYDAVICAFGAWDKENLKLYPKVAAYLCTLLKNSSTRILFVGGAGSLYMNKEHTLMLLETADFPAEYKDVAQAGLEYLNEVRKHSDVNWTFISPAADFRADGEKKGKYKICGEEFTVNSNGESCISYADYAAAVIDEVITTAPHIKERISVIWE